jgi:hypothetical protein
MSQKMGMGKNAKMDVNALSRLEKKMKTSERMRANLEKKKADAAARLSHSIQKNSQGVSVFSVPGEKQEQSFKDERTREAKEAKEDIDNIIKEFKLEDKPASNKKSKKSKKPKN